MYGFWLSWPQLYIWVEKFGFIMNKRSWLKKPEACRSYAPNKPQPFLLPKAISTVRFTLICKGGGQTNCSFCCFCETNELVHPPCKSKELNCLISYRLVGKFLFSLCWPAGNSIVQFTFHLQGVESNHQRKSNHLVHYAPPPRHFFLKKITHTKKHSLFRNIFICTAVSAATWVFVWFHVLSLCRNCVDCVNNFTNSINSITTCHFTVTLSVQ